MTGGRKTIVVDVRGIGQRGKGPNEKENPCGAMGEETLIKLVACRGVEISHARNFMWLGLEAICDSFSNGIN